MNRRMLHRVLDAAFAALLAAIAIVEIWLPLDSAEGDGSPVLSTVVAVILCAALAFRRVWPLPVALIVLLTWPIVFAIHPILILFWGQLVPIVVATYSVARYARPLGSYVGGLAAVACLLFFDFNVEELQDPGEIFFHWLVVPLSWVIGKVVHTSERRATESRQLAIEIETESRTRVLSAISDERARIARELHDVVAHAVSVMVVQAGAAEQVVTDDPEYARKALATIRTTGADALTEMRRLVAMVRDDDDPGDLRPQPGMGGLEALVDDARSGGLDVSFSAEGDVRALPTGLDLAAYRIVQEALSNVRRHASASRVEVIVRYAPDSVVLEVRDDGTGGHGDVTHGHGLIGMRERAALYGGSLEAVASDGRGFTVRAVLPMVAQ
ncbi:sensor histidine kinase [Glaciibacter superstes]|uniref:sensor histidine kinase n=1 Tax=Glaciibacter superstes TaxID=501023 RepID=UPI0003FFFB05|nr:sensor histidine kinase [Glaciibacter superstes]